MPDTQCDRVAAGSLARLGLVRKRVTAAPSEGVRPRCARHRQPGSPGLVLPVGLPPPLPDTDTSFRRRSHLLPPLSCCCHSDPSPSSSTSVTSRSEHWPGGAAVSASVGLSGAATSMRAGCPRLQQALSCSSASCSMNSFSSQNSPGGRAVARKHWLG